MTKWTTQTGRRIPQRETIAPITNARIVATRPAEKQWADKHSTCITKFCYPYGLQSCGIVFYVLAPSTSWSPTIQNGTMAKHAILIEIFICADCAYWITRLVNCVGWSHALDRLTVTEWGLGSMSCRQPTVECPRTTVFRYGLAVKW